VFVETMIAQSVVVAVAAVAVDVFVAGYKTMRTRYTGEI